MHTWEEWQADRVVFSLVIAFQSFSLRHDLAQLLLFKTTLSAMQPFPTVKTTLRCPVASNLPANEMRSAGGLVHYVQRRGFGDDSHALVFCFILKERGSHWKERALFSNLQTIPPSFLLPRANSPLCPVCPVLDSVSPRSTRAFPGVVRPVAGG